MRCGCRTDGNVEMAREFGLDLRAESQEKFSLRINLVILHCVIAASIFIQLGVSDPEGRTEMVSE